jgi:hypothetical protein
MPITILLQLLRDWEYSTAVRAMADPISSIGLVIISWMINEDRLYVMGSEKGIKVGT